MTLQNVERRVFQHVDYYIIVEENILNEEVLDFFITKKDMPLMYMYGLQKTDVDMSNLWDFILNSVDDYIELYASKYEESEDWFVTRKECLQFQILFPTLNYLQYRKSVCVYDMNFNERRNLIWKLTVRKLNMQNIT